MDSKTRILHAAISVFAEKGPHGARMEDIGAAAEINKAMVYYYYSSKENLFQEAVNLVISRIYSEIVTGMKETAAETRDPVLMLERFVRLHFAAYSKSREWSTLLMDVLKNRPEYLRTAFLNAFNKENIQMNSMIEEAFRRGVEQGLFRDIDFKQVFISIIGMNVIYFWAYPIAEIILNLEIGDEKDLLEAREDCIVDLLLRGLLKNREPSSG